MLRGKARCCQERFAHPFLLLCHSIIPSLPFSHSALLPHFNHCASVTEPSTFDNHSPDQPPPCIPCSRRWPTTTIRFGRRVARRDRRARSLGQHTRANPQASMGHWGHHARALPSIDHALIRTLSCPALCLVHSVKRFNNWVKSVLIHRFAPPNAVALDLCCGKVRKRPLSTSMACMNVCPPRALL